MTTQDELRKMAEEKANEYELRLVINSNFDKETAGWAAMGYKAGWLAGREAGLIEASDKGGYAAWQAFHDGVYSDWGFSDAVTTAIRALLTKEDK